MAERITEYGQGLGEVRLTYREAVREFKRELIASAIRKHGSVSAAAKALHMSRTYLQKLCVTLKVQRPTCRNGRRGNWGDEARA